MSISQQPAPVEKKCVFEPAEYVLCPSGEVRFKWVCHGRKPTEFVDPYLLPEVVFRRLQRGELRFKTNRFYESRKDAIEDLCSACQFADARNVVLSIENEMCGPNRAISRLMITRSGFDETKNEERIVWLEDAFNLDYVRETFNGFCRRRKGPAMTRSEMDCFDGRLVGYAELKDDNHSRATSGFFRRRFFFLKKHDRDSEPDGCYRVGTPSEGIDPATVDVGIPGILTNRAWYGRNHRRIVSGELLAMAPVYDDK